jgi:hypothetical protein
MGRKSGCRSRGELKRRRSNARTEISTADSTGAAYASKLAGARPVSIGPTVAHALSSARAIATNADLIMAPPVAGNDTPNTERRQENPYAASSTKPFQVRM